MTRRFMRDNRERILKECSFEKNNLETRIFDLLCEGYLEKEIAEEVFLSERTVTRRIASIRAKIEAASKNWR